MSWLACWNGRWSRAHPCCGLAQKNGKPNHPQTQGKVERFQPNLKNWLAAQNPQPATLAPLQALLDTFTRYYNTRRPHKSLPDQATPATACAARPKASPGGRSADTHVRPHRQRRHHRHRHPPPRRPPLPHRHRPRHTPEPDILLLVQDLDIRIIHAATGELLRDLTLDPTRNYQPTGRPPGPNPRTPRP